MFPNVVSVTHHWLAGLFDGSYLDHTELDAVSFRVI